MGGLRLDGKERVWHGSLSLCRLQQVKVLASVPHVHSTQAVFVIEGDWGKVSSFRNDYYCDFLRASAGQHFKKTSPRSRRLHAHQIVIEGLHMLVTVITAVPQLEVTILVLAHGRWCALAVCWHSAQAGELARGQGCQQQQRRSSRCRHLGQRGSWLFPVAYELGRWQWPAFWGRASQRRLHPARR